MVLSVRYRLIILGKQHVPRTGPVLIAANHVSWLDGFFLAAACPRRGKALVSADYVDWPLLGSGHAGLAWSPCRFSGPKAHRAMFETCRRILDEGGVLGIFPEAQLSRNGLPGPFHRGLEVIIAGRDQVAVVPAFLDNVWGSIFSFSGGRFFRKRPQGLRRTVIIAFGPPVPPPVSIFAVRQAVLEAGVTAYEPQAATAPAGDDRSVLASPGPSRARARLRLDRRLRSRRSPPDWPEAGDRGPSLARRRACGWSTATAASGPPAFQVDSTPGSGDGCCWTDTGWTGSIDRDGFVRIEKR